MKNNIVLILIMAGAISAPAVANTYFDERFEVTSNAEISDDFPGWTEVHVRVRNNTAQRVEGDARLSFQTMFNRVVERHSRRIAIDPGSEATAVFLARANSDNQGIAEFVVGTERVTNFMGTHLGWHSSSETVIVVGGERDPFEHVPHQRGRHTYSRLKAALHAATDSDALLLIDANLLLGSDSDDLERVISIARSSRVIFIAQNPVDHPILRSIFGVQATHHISGGAHFNIRAIEGEPNVFAWIDSTPAILAARDTGLDAKLILFDPPHPGEESDRARAWRKVFPSVDRNAPSVLEKELIDSLAPTPPYIALLAGLLIYVLAIPLIFARFKARAWRIVPLFALSSLIIIFAWAWFGAGSSFARRSLEITIVPRNGIAVQHLYEATYSGRGLAEERAYDYDGVHIDHRFNATGLPPAEIRWDGERPLVRFGLPPRSAMFLTAVRRGQAGEFEKTFQRSPNGTWSESFPYDEWIDEFFEPSRSYAVGMTEDATTTKIEVREL